MAFSDRPEQNMPYALDKESSKPRGFNLLKDCGLNSCLRAQLLTATQSLLPAPARLRINAQFFAVAVWIEGDVPRQGSAAEFS